MRAEAENEENTGFRRKDADNSGLVACAGNLSGGNINFADTAGQTADTARQTADDVGQVAKARVQARAIASRTAEKIPGDYASCIALPQSRRSAELSQLESNPILWKVARPCTAL